MYKQSIQNSPDSRVWYKVKKRKFFKLLSGETITKHSPLPLKISHKLFFASIFLYFFVRIFNFGVLEELKRDYHLSFICFGVFVVCGVILYMIDTIYPTSRDDDEARVQKRYYELAKIKEPTLKQRCALRLDLVGDYFYKTWNETIEDYPMESVYHKDYDFFKKHGYFYNEIKECKKEINNDWDIKSKKDYQVVFERLCYYGYHLDSFLDECLFGYECDENIKELSAISHLSQDTIRSYLTPKDDMPIKAIWGYEWWRALAVTRLAYKCEYIDQKLAWENLLKLSSFVHYLFDDFDDFYTNYILGNAFWARNEKLSQKKHEMFELYKKKCHWPQRDLPWEKTEVQLPRSCARMNDEGIRRKKGSSV